MGVEVPVVALFFKVDDPVAAAGRDGERAGGRDHPGGKVVKQNRVDLGGTRIM